MSADITSRYTLPGLTVRGTVLKVDVCAITFTSAAPTEAFNLLVDTTNFPSLAGYGFLKMLGLYVFKAKLTGAAATVTPYMLGAGGWPICKAQPSSAASFEVADCGFGFAPLAFEATLGDTLSVVAGPNIAGSGIVLVGIGRCVASWA